MAAPAALPQAGALRVQGRTGRRILNLAVVAAGIIALCVAAAIVVPMLFGYRPLVILSGSMEPALPTGSVVILQPAASDSLKLGDVIAYTPEGSGHIPIVHRIARIQINDGVRYYTLRGDANKTEDANKVELAQTAWKVWYHVPLAGYLIGFAGSRVGFVVTVVVPGVALIALTGKGLLASKAPTPAG